jgi:hypothetical protein
MGIISIFTEKNHKKMMNDLFGKGSYLFIIFKIFGFPINIIILNWTVIYCGAFLGDAGFLVFFFERNGGAWYFKHFTIK